MVTNGVLAPKVTTVAHRCRPATAIAHAAARLSVAGDSLPLGDAVSAARCRKRYRGRASYPGAIARSVASKSVLATGPTHGELAPASW
jgi:hypothetical protein